MEITPDQKRLLQAVDPEIDASFADGVSSVGTYLDPVPGYKDLPQNLRPVGVRGVLSTFAGLIKQMALFVPSKTPLAYVNGFGPWGSLANENGQYYKNLMGEVVVEGLISCATEPGVTAAAVLPVGFRPTKNHIFSVARNDVSYVVTVVYSGEILVSGTTAGDWISLDGIRFYPG